MVPDIPSYIKDITHFLQLIQQPTLRGTLTANTLLATLDVDSLYTNIPQDEGIQAVRDIIRSHRNHTQGDLHMLTMTTLLKMVLELNNFEFNGTHYLQIGGTAMGTQVALTFANIFMARFEKLHVYPYPLQPDIWLRFIDDTFLIWNHLDEFLLHLNAVHPTIKFTMEASPSEVHFLDMRVLLKQAQISTSLYTKPTDTNNLLHFQSAHPTHCRRGIPFGQLLRLRRICTDFTDFLSHGIVKAKQFLDRGYPLQLLSKELLQAAILDRHYLLKEKNHLSPANLENPGNK